MNKIFTITLLLLTFYQFLIAKVEYVVYPSLGYSDETGIYAGGLAYLRYGGIEGDSTSQKNLIYFSTEVSEKKQYSIHLMPEIHFKNGKYSFLTNAKFKHWPSTFYGIGNEHISGEDEQFTKREYDIKIEFTKKMTNTWQTGFIYELSQFQIEKTEENGLLAIGVIPGSEENTTSGIGLSISYDTRDSDTYPQNGLFYNFKSILFSDTFASDYSFIRAEIDLRHYLSIFPNQTLAIQGYFSTVSDEVPFHKMSYLDDNMRAVTANKFIDRHSIVFRIENRIFPWSHPLLERFGFVAFLETGEVAGNLEDLSINRLKLSYGTGLRISFLMNDRLNVRLDIGFGEQNQSLSMGSREEF
ncbi:MAG: BamA/TamA family outer membrane protein [Candidatus Cloacimonetes bacterium]|jgi:outer membrane protein assembly factor BamA|nr:BamA/TamA family outer membrane protein [Candidatus Cloacimonadota bacterium]